MAFRRVRRRCAEARKARDVMPIIEELLQAIEGNGMTLRGWFEVLDQLAIDNIVTQSELIRGMRMLEMNGTDRKKQPVLTADKVPTGFTTHRRERGGNGQIAVAGYCTENDKSPCVAATTQSTRPTQYTASTRVCHGYKRRGATFLGDDVSEGVGQRGNFVTSTRSSTWEN